MFLESFALYNISDAGSSEGYLTVEGNAGDRNDLSAWHSGVCLGCDVYFNSTDRPLYRMLLSKRLPV